MIVSYFDAPLPTPTLSLAPPPAIAVIRQGEMQYLDGPIAKWTSGHFVLTRAGFLHWFRCGWEVWIGVTLVQVWMGVTHWLMDSVAASN